MKRNKAEFDIYKTYGEYSCDELKYMGEDIASENPDYSEDEVQHEVGYLVNEVYWDDFKYEVKDFDRTHEGTTYRIDIHFGTWYGAQEGYVDRGSLEDAIYAALDNLEDFRIYEDGYGKLLVSGSHHDSSDNHMVISVLKNGKRRNVHFCKQAYGVGY